MTLFAHRAYIKFSSHIHKYVYKLKDKKQHNNNLHYYNLDNNDIAVSNVNERLSVVHIKSMFRNGHPDVDSDILNMSALGTSSIIIW